MYYKAATFLLKKSLNFFLVRKVSIILKMVCLSSSSRSWIILICSRADLSVISPPAITEFTGTEISLSYPNAFASCVLAVTGRCGVRCSFAVGAATGVADEAIAQLKTQYVSQESKNYELLDYVTAINYSEVASKGLVNGAITALVGGGLEAYAFGGFSATKVLLLVKLKNKYPVALNRIKDSPIKSELLDVLGGKSDELLEALNNPRFYDDFGENLPLLRTFVQNPKWVKAWKGLIDRPE